jgi:hypothetical protein
LPRNCFGPSPSRPILKSNTTPLPPVSHIATCRPDDCGRACRVSVRPLATCRMPSATIRSAQNHAPDVLLQPGSDDVLLTPCLSHPCSEFNTAKGWRCPEGYVLVDKPGLTSRPNSCRSGDVARNCTFSCFCRYVSDGSPETRDGSSKPTNRNGREGSVRGAWIFEANYPSPTHDALHPFSIRPAILTIEKLFAICGEPRLRTRRRGAKLQLIPDRRGFWQSRA